MRPCVSVSSVRPLVGYRLRLGLTDGSVVERDVSALLADPVSPRPVTNYFIGIVRRARREFRDVRVVGGGLAWPGGYDMSPSLLVWGKRPRVRHRPPRYLVL